MIEKTDDGVGEARGATAGAASAPIEGALPTIGGVPYLQRRVGRHALRWLAVPAAVAVFVLSVALAKGLHQPAFAESALIGKQVPSFTLQSIGGGRPVESANFRGQVVVVNFWASWCVPCREEAATLEQFAQRNVGASVVLIGVLYSDTRSNALDFRDEFGLTYPLVDDPSGTTAIDFGVRGVPETFVIGPDGRVMARLIGAVGPTTLDDVVKRVLTGQTFSSKNEHYRSGPNPSSPSVSSSP